MTENGDDIVAALERVAIMAEVANYWTDEHRLMPATGVADVIYEAMHTIVDLRIDLEVAEEADHVAKAIELLERIAAHDHQKMAAMALRNPLTGPVERMKNYEDILRAAAQTDIQSWAQQALLHLKGENQ